MFWQNATGDIIPISTVSKSMRFTRASGLKGHPGFRGVPAAPKGPLTNGKGQGGCGSGPRFSPSKCSVGFAGRGDGHDLGNCPLLGGGEVFGVIGSVLKDHPNRGEAETAHGTPLEGQFRASRVFGG